MKFSEILSKNSLLRVSFKDKEALPIKVLSNITINQLKEVLEMKLMETGIKPDISFGDFDNIVQESINLSSIRALIIFWELSDIIDGFYYKAESMPEKELSALLEKLKNEIRFVFENIRNLPIVFFNLFSCFRPDNSLTPFTKVNQFADELNRFVSENKPMNTYLVDKKLLSYSNIDWRFYYMAKAPYNINFFLDYSEFIKPAFFSLAGKVSKALIFDCDNTLWKGILGEDGFDNIEMSSSYEGKIFEEVQYLAKALSKRGVLIGLCSKNNSADVDEVLKSHPDMILRDSDITIKKVNWNDKADNLVSIAEELNIGLDSLVFIDDSNFEIENIKSRLPEIKSVSVPAAIHEYPRLFKEISSLFYSRSNSREDINKTGMYKIENLRKQNKNNFSNIEDYLQSLELKLRINIDVCTQVSRLSQLSQKTNQFNLTTKRYSEAEITALISSDIHRVYSFSLEDKFGEYGLTGMAILEIKNDCATVDTFLMSCRVLGRNIEHNFFDYIFNDLTTYEVKCIKACYIKTIKNSQVENFWENYGFELQSVDEFKKYSLPLSQYINLAKPYIKQVEK